MVRICEQSVGEAGMLKIVAVVDPTAIKYQAGPILFVKVISRHSPSEVSGLLSKFD